MMTTAEKKLNAALKEGYAGWMRLPLRSRYYWMRKMSYMIDVDIANDKWTFNKAYDTFYLSSKC